MCSKNVPCAGVAKWPNATDSRKLSDNKAKPITEESVPLVGPQVRMPVIFILEESPASRTVYLFEEPYLNKDFLNKAEIIKP